MSNSPAPLAPDDAVATEPPAPQVVLLVEDDDTLRTLTRMMLEGGGFAVVECATARYALEVLTHQPAGIDLLLTDVSLPGMTGPDLVHAAQRVRPDLPAVYMTGWDRARLYMLGVPAHALVLTKPFSQGDVVGVAHRALWTVSSA